MGQLRRDQDGFPNLFRACVHLKICRTGCVEQNFVESSRLV